MAIVILAYFMGVPLVFTKFTDAETTEKLVNDVIVLRHGPRYWTLLIVALIVSTYLAYQFVVLTQRTPFSGIHFGLGFAAILSAFITPSYTDTSFPENDIFG